MTDPANDDWYAKIEREILRSQRRALIVTPALAILAALLILVVIKGMFKLP